MKSSMIALSIAAVLAFNTANAATAPTTLTPQEVARVKSHSNVNNNRVAAPDAAAKTMTPQQQKMGGCAKANKGKKGDDYKSAVSACMKGSGHASESL